MANVLQGAIEWLDGQRKAHSAQRVVYSRGAETVGVVASIGATTFEVEERAGYVRVQSRDFLISTADLVIGGARVLPERGDRIRETVGSEAFVYEVLAPGAEPHYRYSDPYRQMLRIHTKHIATEAAS